jgi:hypothetical protein
MKHYYGTTTEVVVTISETIHDDVYWLNFAERFNAWPQNPPSSNPFQLFLDYSEIVRTNDIQNPKFVAHKAGVKKGIRIKHKAGTPDRKAALRTVRVMGIHAMQPYLAILEVDKYLTRTGLSEVPRVSPLMAGSPTSVEYLIIDIEGPNTSDPELHLEKLHF